MDYFGQIIQRYPGENLFWVHASAPAAGTLNMGRYATRRQLDAAHRPAIAGIAAANQVCSFVEGIALAFGDADEVKGLGRMCEAVAGINAFINASAKQALADAFSAFVAATTGQPTAETTDAPAT